MYHGRVDGLRSFRKRGFSTRRPLMAVAPDDACAVLAAMTSRGRSDSKPVGACVKGVGTSRMLGLESMFSGTASAYGSQGGVQTPSKGGHRMIGNSARARLQRSIPVRHPILHYFVSHRASGGKHTVLSSQPSSNTGCFGCRNILARTHAIGNSILRDRRNVQDLHDRAYQNRSQMLSITIKNLETSNEYFLLRHSATQPVPARF